VTSLLFFVAVLAGDSAPATSGDVPAKYEAAWAACRNENLKGSFNHEMTGCGALIAAEEVDNEIKAIAHANRGMLMAQAGLLVTAKSELDEAIKLNPKLAPAYYNRGMVFEATAHAKAAIADYSAAITALPTMVEAYINRGIIYAQSGQSDLALADFNKAIELEPGSEDLYENRAQLLREMGRSAEADADLAKAKLLMKQ